jgi:hypothetical protein
MLAGVLAGASAAGADAQTGPYPNKPVQIITDSSAGSTPDDLDRGRHRRPAKRARLSSLAPWRDMDATRLEKKSREA